MMDAITPDAMLGILKRPNAEAESALFERLRYLDRVTKLSYSEIGYISKTVQVYRLHEHRMDPKTGQPCSFTRWLRLAAPWGYSTAFQAMRDVEDLADIPAEHLTEIPQSNFFVLKQLSTAVRSEPSVIEAAKVMTADALVEHLAKKHPDQHIETSKILRVRMEESALAVVEEAIRQAVEHGAGSRGDALEQIASDYLLSQRRAR